METLERESLNLIQKFYDENDPELKRALIQDYLQMAEDCDSHFIFPCGSFSEELKWLNCESQLNLKDFDNKLVLFDFFTYCCINCIHIMPFLHKLEKTHPVSEGLAVVGIHSAKFPNEKLEANIEDAIRRYNIQHPVVNDSELVLWEQLAVKCWPTLILMSPAKKILFSIPGESHTGFIEKFVDIAVEVYERKGLLDDKPLPVRLGVASEDCVDGKMVNDKLYYPGKIAIDQTGERIAIADSGNHRVIITDVEGNVSHIVGNGNAGCADGVFSKAEFMLPQGVAWHGTKCVFVADCDSHAIRKIDFTINKVVTVAGTGKQGQDLEGGQPGLDQPISSPWDLVVGGSPRIPDGNSILYIAMSGCHQIWSLFLKRTDFQKGAELDLGTCIRYAGSGKEENRNNSYPHKAGFAQPSGLALDVKSHSLFVADSESSTIRRINLSNGAVQAVAGGEIDPMNLFAYGDVDGQGRDVKLQHPLAVAWDHKKNELYVADSYNHKIKTINPATKTCTTITDLLCEDGSKATFNEPGGMCIDPQCKVLYIADTNNHGVKTVCLETKLVKFVSTCGKTISSLKRKLNFTCSKILQTPNTLQFSLKFHNTPPVNEDLETVVDGPTPNFSKPLGRKNQQPTKLSPISVFKETVLNLEILHDFKLNDSAPSVWQLSCFLSEKSISCSDQRPLYLHSGSFLSNQLKQVIKIAEVLNLCSGHGDHTEECVVNLLVESLLYHCLDGDVCSMLSYKAVIPVFVMDSNQKSPSATNFKDVSIKIS